MFYTKLEDTNNAPITTHPKVDAVRKPVQVVLEDSVPSYPTQFAVAYLPLQWKKDRQ